MSRPLTAQRVSGVITPIRAARVARVSVAVTMIWFGAMNFTPVGAAIMAGWLGGHVLLSVLTAQASVLAQVLGSVQLAAGLVLATGGFGRPAVLRIGVRVVATIAGGALTLLLTNPVWMDSLGGFPAIGAGQGVIKYVAILGLALYLLRPLAMGAEARLARYAEPVMLLGIVLVLVWIGGMKFTLPEADGIDPLLRSSPFFSWMPLMIAKQTASNMIGVVEIVTALALFGWWRNRAVFLIGAALAAGTFVATLSFLVTLPGWQMDLGGFPALSRSGHFLLKDLLLLAAVFVLVAESISRDQTAPGDGNA